MKKLVLGILTIKDKLATLPYNYKSRTLNLLLLGRRQIQSIGSSKEYYRIKWVRRQSRTLKSSYRCSRLPLGFHVNQGVLSHGSHWIF